MSSSRRAARPLAVGLAGIVVLAGCSAGAASPTATPSPTMVAPMSAPGSADPAQSAPPAGSADPSASGSPAPSLIASPGVSQANPDRTLPPDMAMWPTSVINATLALGALDNEIKRAGADLVVASQEGDLELLLGASRGLADLARQSVPNAERLTTYPDTEAVGTSYIPVLHAIDSAASGLGDGLLAGDSEAVERASIELAAAIRQYETVRPALVDAVDLALIMRRGLLVK
jgi:hypothetical protein